MSAERIPGTRRPEVLLVAALTAGLTVAAAALPPVALGDSGEYLLTTEAFHAHGTPIVRLGDLATMGRLATEHTLHGSFASLLRTFAPTRQEGRASIHFWLYPLACVPARAVLGRLGLNPLAAPQVTNALLFGLAALAVALSPLPAAARRSLLALFVLSPALWFVRWPHPEVYSASLTLAALVAAQSGAWTAAVLCAALASTQNAPLILLVAALLVPAVLRARSQGWRPLALLGLAALPAALPFAWSQWAFGTPSVLARVAADRANLSLARGLELLFDLNLGLLPWMPLAVVGAVLASARAAVRRDRLAWHAAGWGLVLAMATLCTMTQNWNHGTFGPSRYAVWLMPFVIVLAVQPLRQARPAPGWVAFLAVAVATQGVIVLGRGGPTARSDFHDHSPAARFVLARWPALYNPTFEVFLERTRHMDFLWPPGPVGPAVWRDTEGRCRKVLLQKRHLPEVRAACGGDPQGVDAFVAGVRERGRETWGYLEYGP